jgi:pimeloyl-ACP methyl ester carboxylesterase
MKPIYWILSVVSWVFRCNGVKLGLLLIEKQLKLHGVHSYQLDSEFYTLRFWKGGKGPALLFLHGFGADALLTWRKELLHFSKTHTVIAPDLLWFGKSSAVMPPELSSQRIVMQELLAALGFDTVSIVGQSYGGFVALDLVAKGNISTKKLLIANCPGTTFDVTTLRKVCSKYQVNQITELFVLETPEHLKRLMKLSSHKDIFIPKNVLQQLYDLFFEKHHPQLRTLLNSLPHEQQRYKDASPFREKDMLVLWGEFDELFPLVEGIKFANDAEAQFKILPDCGHMSQTDDPKAFRNAIKTFIFNDFSD